MAYEQRPRGNRGRGKAADDGVVTVRIEKGGDEGHVNAQILNYINLGYEVKEDRFCYTATASREHSQKIHRDVAERGSRQVLGTKAISKEDKEDGMYLSTVEELQPVTASQLADLDS